MSGAERIKRIHEATGLGWIAAKEFVEHRPDELVSRIIEAKEKQSDRILHDPIEDRPEMAATFDVVRRRAEETLDRWTATVSDGFRKRPLGSCHLVWSEMRKVLKEEHGVLWFTPAEMNPGSVFD